MMKFFTIALTIVSLNIFAQHKITGTILSFNSAFKKLLQSDGAQAQEWDIEIGKMIKTHPTNFLKSLRKYEKRIRRLGPLVGNLGYEFIDELEKSKLEAKERIKSLEKAKSRNSNKELKRLADLCIKELLKYENY